MVGGTDAGEETLGIIQVGLKIWDCSQAFVKLYSQLNETL